MGDEGRLVAGRYRLVERIGSGAMGVVWRARDEVLHRTVAVKQLLVTPGSGEGPEQAAQRAMREGRIAARLQHQNAVTVYDVAEDDDQPWLVMEYVPSRSLSAVLSEQGTLPPGQVARIGTQVAAALAAAHAAGIVHRDVKPGNVLLTDDGVVKITDFGISRATDDVVLTATGLLSGTPAYLAPEVAQGEPPAPSSDVFALGSTLYTAIEGQPPFGLGENTLALLHVVAAGKVTPPRHAGALTPTLMRLLAYDPATRPEMADASVQLAAFTADETRPAITAVTPRQLRPPQQSRPQPVPPPAPQRPQSRPLPVPPPQAPRGNPATALAPRPPAKRDTRFKLLLGLAVVVVLALITAGVLVVRGYREHRQDLVQQPGTGTITGGPAAGSTSVVAEPGTTAGHPQAVVTYESMHELVERYYALLPQHPDQAWPLLTPEFQQKTGGLATFEAFYGTISQITVSRTSPVAPGQIAAVLNFTKAKGGVTHERYRFSVVARDGQLLIANGARVGAA